MLNRLRIVLSYSSISLGQSGVESRFFNFKHWRSNQGTAVRDNFEIGIVYLLWSVNKSIARNSNFTKVSFQSAALLSVCLFVVTPPLPRNGGTAYTAIQVYAVNLIEIRLGQRWQPISNQS